jgi:hypothetical protein
VLDEIVYTFVVTFDCLMRITALHRAVLEHRLDVGGSL